LQTHQRSRNLFRQSKVVNLVKRTSLVATFGLLCVVSVLGSSPAGANAQSHPSCAEPEAHYGASDEASNVPAIYNDVSLVSTGQAGSAYTQSTACQLNRAALRADVLSNSVQDIRVKLLKYRVKRALQVMNAQPVSQVVRKPRAIKPSMTTRRNVVRQAATHFNFARVSNVAAGFNPFPYGQCTWWADQRYYQLHNVFVPWHSNANAYQWTARAYEFGWRVSGVPHVGDIMVLQPGVQGAYYVGHVAVVEQVLSSGRFIASSMNWGGSRGAVSDAQFYAGPGVSFISL
jgi:surface antigen